MITTVQRISLLVLIATIVAPLAWSRGTSEPNDQIIEPLPEEARAYPPYLSLVDGLHITGTPVVVNLDTYRLAIIGKVDTPGSYTFDEVKSMTSQDVEMVLECPGFFEDSGVWTGTALLELLKAHGMKPNARGIRFHSVSGTYSATLPIEQLNETEVLIAWAFNGDEFPVYHGFPLRVAAKDVAGATWVKWLGSIEVE